MNAMRRLSIAFACLLAMVALPAAAQQAHVDLEQRLSAEQLRETGLDKLSKEQLAAAPGVRLVSEEARMFPGPNPSIYAFTKVTTQRNIYRVPVPD